MEQMKRIVEAALMASERPLNIDSLQRLFDDGSGQNIPSNKDIKDVLTLLIEDYQHRAINLVEVASGYRFQICKEVAPWVQKLWQERPPRYSRAMLETLALIVYRQPITRAEIEDIRGVSVSTTAIKTLLERDWIKIIGHKDLPGRPALYATTKQFLDDFNLKSLEQLPSLMEVQDLDKLETELNLQLKLDVAPVQQAEESDDTDSQGLPVTAPEKMLQDDDVVPKSPDTSDHPDQTE